MFDLQANIGKFGSVTALPPTRIKVNSYALLSNKLVFLKQMF